MTIATWLRSPENLRRKEAVYEDTSADDIASTGLVTIHATVRLEHGAARLVANQPSVLLGIPCDWSVVGYGGKTINTLQLWEAGTPHDCDFGEFNSSSSCACQYDARSARLSSSCQRADRQALPRISLSHGTYCLTGVFLSPNPHIEAWKIKGLYAATVPRLPLLPESLVAGIDLALPLIRVAIRHEGRCSSRAYRDRRESAAAGPWRVDRGASLRPGGHPCAQYARSLSRGFCVCIFPSCSCYIVMSYHRSARRHARPGREHEHVKHFGMCSWCRVPSLQHSHPLHTSAP